MPVTGQFLYPCVPGERYGMLVVQGETIEVRQEKHRVRRLRMWQCECDCGKQTRASRLDIRSGRTRSCGCRIGEGIGARSTTHGKTDTPEHRVWRHMLGRCFNPTDDAYRNYGARGITVCERWRTFENFLADMGERPTNNHTIERKNNDGNYEPDNCVWLPRPEQNRNRRPYPRWGERLGE